MNEYSFSGRGGPGRPVGGVYAALTAVTAFAWWLRVVGLGDMRLAGDSAYSLQAATEPLAAIALGRVSDGHPPFSYWLLHLALPLFGATELGVRLPSALVGLLAVPLAWAAGRRLGGAGSGLLAAGLVALSPLLVFYAREPRMYALLPVCGLASAVLLERRRWAGYAAFALAGLWSHYYMLPLVLGQAIWVLVARRAELPTARRVWAALALGFAPWLLFALAQQTAATAGVISNAEPPHGPLGFVESFWTPFHAGPGLDWPVGALLGLLAALGWLAAGRALRRADPPPLARLIGLSSAVVVGLAFALFLVAPYAVRPRFWTVLLPGYLVVAAWGIATLLPGRRLAAALAALAALHAVTLYAGHRVGRLTLERDAVLLADRLAAWAEPDDALAIQAGWQLGYLRAHHPGPAIVSRPLEALGEPPGRLPEHGRAWLVVHADGKHVNPWEVWLDDHWGRAATFEIAQAHAVLYARPPPIVQTPPIAFRDPDGHDALWLVGLGSPPARLRPGDVLPLGLRWRSPDLAAPTRVTPFLHVVDGRGERRFGADDEPRNGYDPTFRWRPAEEVDDARALLVPDDLPPGEYWLALGMYPSGGGPRLEPAAAGDPTLPRFPDLLTLARVEVVPRDRPRAAHELDRPLAPGATLTGWSGELDEFQALPRGEVRWTTVDRWPLHGRRDYVQRHADTSVALRVRFDEPPTAGLRLRVALSGPAGVVEREAVVEPTRVVGERLVRVHLPVPGEGPLVLAVEGYELARLRVDG
jgi:4-amino-4-deoxy-L-arabinose transferase-like glycosyltransferase